MSRATLDGTAPALSLKLLNLEAQCLNKSSKVFRDEYWGFGLSIAHLVYCSLTAYGVWFDHSALSHLAHHVQNCNLISFF